MPAVKKELPGREDLALALAAFRPTLAALPLPPLPGYLTPLPASAALPPAASLPAATAGYEALLAPSLRSPRAYLSLHEAAPYLHLPRDPLALERFSATAAAAPDFQPLLDNGEPCIEVECGANRALLYVRKLCQGSKGPSIRHRGEWLTPNEFQFVSGRETAKDWKRSIRHKGAAATVPPLRSPRTPGSGPPHSATWETPSPPREGAAAPGLQQRHSPASPPNPPPAPSHLRSTVALVDRGRAPSASTVTPAWAAVLWAPNCTQAGPSSHSEGLCGIPGHCGSGEVYGNSGNCGRPAGRDTLPSLVGEPPGSGGSRGTHKRPGCGWDLVEGRGRCVGGAGRWGPRGRASGAGAGARAELERQRGW